jgi:hypothetical protein
VFGAANTLIGSSSGYLDANRHTGKSGSFSRPTGSYNGDLEGGIYPPDSNLAFIGDAASSVGVRTEVHVAGLALVALVILIGARSLGFRSIIAVSR